MRRVLSLVLVFLSFTTCSKSPSSSNNPMSQDRVLVFSKTTGFRHDSIADGIAAIQQLGRDNQFAVDASEDAAAFTDQNLSKYKAIVFLNTTGDLFNDELVERLHTVYRGAPATNLKAYRKAQKALQENEDMTFTDAEIDAFLPNELRRHTA